MENEKSHNDPRHVTLLFSMSWSTIKSTVAAEIGVTSFSSSAVVSGLEIHVHHLKPFYARPSLKTERTLASIGQYFTRVGKRRWSGRVQCNCGNEAELLGLCTPRYESFRAGEPGLHRFIGLRYDTRCYFNVRSKADISQLNLPHGTDN